MKYSIQDTPSPAYNYVRCILPLSCGSRHSIIVEAPRNWDMDDIDMNVYELVDAIRGYTTGEEEWEIEYLYYEEVRGSVFFSMAR